MKLEAVTDSIDRAVPAAYAFFPKNLQAFAVPVYEQEIGAERRVSVSQCSACSFSCLMLT